MARGIVFEAFYLTLFCASPCVQDKELRDIRNRMQDKEAELDTLRKAGKNLRERLDEKEVETRGIMDRVRCLHGINAAMHAEVQNRWPSI